MTSQSSDVIDDCLKSYWQSLLGANESIVVDIFKTYVRILFDSWFILIHKTKRQVHILTGTTVCCQNITSEIPASESQNV